MSRLYGTLKGAGKVKVTRRGHIAIVTEAAGWRGCVRTEVYRDGDVDRYLVLLTPWQSSGGQQRVLAEGVLDATA